MGNSSCGSTGYVRKNATWREKRTKANKQPKTKKNEKKKKNSLFAAAVARLPVS